ncbi:MAG: hypothetical protein DRR19_19780 [Candidatus Parabeggiatoa sp. nov. 1]|nr:MAG: hypothetical protein DRR19_19780 [Gammaproteobacteria bacterium]
MAFFIKRQNILTVFGLWFLSNTVLAIPTIQLSTNTVTGGENITLTATGGLPPYLWFTEAGDLDQTLDDTGSTAILTAPQVAGDFSITLRDSEGIQTKAEFHVSWQHFSVTPEYVYMEPGQTITFGLHGVTSEVQVIDENVGSWTWLPETEGQGIRYTAPEKPGFYAIHFSQKNDPSGGRIAYAKVYTPLKAVEPDVYLEDYQKIGNFLQVKGGVPPYLWIEGGKGQLEPQGTERDQMRYIPGEIIGPEIITVYDSTGNSVEIQVTVKGNFRVSPRQHSVCLEDTTVKFQASGGEPPYRLEPPSQGGWQILPKTDNDSLTLQFTQTGFFELVGSDQAGQTAIAKVTVDPPPCNEGSLNLEPAGPVYQYVHPDNFPNSIMASVKGAASGQVEWICQGACTQQDFQQTKGKLTTFYPPATGHYELAAEDNSGRRGILEIHIARDLISLYAGFDNKIDPSEMQTALDAFFALGFCCADTEFYYLVEHFMQNQ